MLLRIQDERKPAEKGKKWNLSQKNVGGEKKSGVVGFSKKSREEIDNLLQQSDTSGLNLQK